MFETERDLAESYFRLGLWRRWPSVGAWEGNPRWAGADRLLSAGFTLTGSLVARGRAPAL